MTEKLAKCEQQIEDLAAEAENDDSDTAETQEWLDALEGVIQAQGTERAAYLLSQLKDRAFQRGVRVPFTANTPYINTITAGQQPSYPGNREIERRIKSLVRWNALAMVVRANKHEPGIGGHISTYASAANLFEVGFNHFFRGPAAEGGADQVYFQGHASPGIYARAFLEGRLSVTQLNNFRQELADEGGLSSYPHPWLMPDFWQFSSVSMGLGPIMAIYQARFNRYLEHRGLKDTSRQRVWCFVGDGETDEPETLGAVSLAAREKLDNLTFVVNCNLQRLDGPVRGNGKIIQELEAFFRGAGWNVIKVIWGGDWDVLLDHDQDGLLVQRMGEVVDGEYQKYTVESGGYIRQHFFGKYPNLKDLVEHLSDDQLRKLGRGGHDPEKVYAAYKAAVEYKGAPTVILAKTVKGYGLGEAGEGRNVTHQQKKLNEEELREFRSRFGIPISDETVGEAPFYKPPEDSPEVCYLRERRQQLGGFLPSRQAQYTRLQAPPREFFKEFLKGSGSNAVSTTMSFVTILRHIMQDKALGKLIVPIVPDEARTFGMDAFFKPFGIYSNVGQLYEPVDAQMLVSYREAKNGQILEEGITEEGAMASFIAAGTAYAVHGTPAIPFYTFYSMFGAHRMADLVWAAADMRTRGFLLGATSGRTTLAGEGLQHQDGHSHVFASTVPTLRAYDPAFAFEQAIIIQDGIRRMFEQDRDEFYYLTLGNENYSMPPMPNGVEDGILKGMYQFQKAKIPSKGSKVHLLGSGAILREVLRAQDILAEKYGIAAAVWSVTSYKELREEALRVERWNLLHPSTPARQSYVAHMLADEDAGVFIAASDYLKSVPEMIRAWVPGGLYSLGTDGFGRSETRKKLRRFFEVDAEFITLAALSQLMKRGELTPARVQRAVQELEIDAEKADPMMT